jgi:integrase/recombinase XerD
MLMSFFPRAHQRYSSLPVLGSMLDEFTKFLTHLGYRRSVVRILVRPTVMIDSRLRKRKCYSIKKITRTKLRDCATLSRNSQKEIDIATTTKLLEHYFDEYQIFEKEKPNPIERNPIEKKLIDYRCYLEKVRGFSPGTIDRHSTTILQFLNRLSRGTLQHLISHLRAFLKFLVMHGEIQKKLEFKIDTPRVYREEKLPHSLDWEIVRSLLKSIDRSTPTGKRDYAILSLITTYGLRASEIVSLKLENIEWRKNRILIFQRKTSTPLILPLMDNIGESILDYIRQGRPSVGCREIFVRHRAPSGPLKPVAVTDIFQYLAKNSGLEIPFKGVHCLRHSYAVHLLRKGISLKEIGDILGHRNFESTCVYLRLNIEDLRTIPLSIPTLSTLNQGV